MEVNIKTKFNVGDTVYTVSHHDLRIIPITIRSIRVGQAETTEDMKFDTSSRGYKDEGNIKQVIEYSECINIYKRTRNGYSIVDEDIPFYHQEECFATKQELIAHLLSQQHVY